MTEPRQTGNAPCDPAAAAEHDRAEIIVFITRVRHNTFAAYVRRLTSLALPRVEMPKLSGRIHRFVAELTRRKVVRVVIAYTVAALTIIQSAEPISNALGWPTPTLYWIVIILIAGLPVAALLAWAYDIVPDPGPPAESGSEPAGETAAGADPESPDSATSAAAAPARSAALASSTAAGTVLPAAAALPAATTPFIGRDVELRELLGLLADPEVRLITLTGPGGAGKTRLALRAATDHAHATGVEVPFVALSSLPSPMLLAQALAHGLGVPLSRGAEPLAELTDFVRGKKMLLVLDSFDELTAAAGVLSTILERAPGVRMLVTSRGRLNLLQETLLPVDGLALADAVAGGDSDAVTLFAAAARRHDRRFRLDARTRPSVQRICTLVGGMPLALELAAAWVRVLSCDEICAELAHGIDILSTRTPALADRHRSLRATFDASWRLLGPDEQQAAARLAVCRSGFDRRTAEAIADATPAILRMLLDKSLLTRPDDRFVMLDTVRQYGIERLRDEPGAEAEARRRHMHYFAAGLGELERGAIRWDPQTLAAIANLMDEARAAWDCAVERADADTMTLCMDTLFHFYDARGWASEGVDAFGRASMALASITPTSTAPSAASRTSASSRVFGGSTASARPPEQARLTLTGAQLDVRGGALLGRMGRHEEADVLLHRGLAGIEGVVGEGAVSDALIFALHRLGTNCFDQGNYEEADRVWQRAAVLADMSHRQYAIGWSKAHLGSIAFARGRYDEAATLFEAALILLRAEGDRNGIWAATNNLGVIAALRREHDQARLRFREALAVQQELGNRRAVTVLLHNLGSAAVLAGDYAAARAHLEEGLAISEQIGYQSMTAASLASLGDALVLAGELDEARPLLHRALSMAAAAHSYPTALSALVAFARLCYRRGDTERAVELATLVASHPAGDQDIRERAAALLNEAGVSGNVAEPGRGSTELGPVIDDIVMEHVPTFRM